MKESDVAVSWKTAPDADSNYEIVLDFKSVIELAEKHHMEDGKLVISFDVDYYSGPYYEGLFLRK